MIAIAFAAGGLIGGLFGGASRSTNERQLDVKRRDGVVGMMQLGSADRGRSDPRLCRHTPAKAWRRTLLQYGG